MPFSNNFPYTDLHEININKFLKAIKNLLGGHGGEFLRKKSNIPFDYEWSNVGGPSGSVTSVNGQTGAVVLDAADVGALPDSYTPPPAPVQSVNGKTGAVFLDAADVGALPDSYTPPPAPVQSVNGQTGAVVLDAADVGALPNSYTPPPAPVQSVNGQTGAVVLDAADVGALPDSYTPPPAPVQSVNGQTGAVILDADDVGALPNSYVAPVQSVNGQTGAVVIDDFKTAFLTKTITIEASSGYSLFASKSEFGIPSTSTIITTTIQGFSNASVPYTGFSTALGSDGNSVYILGPGSTIKIGVKILYK